VVEDIEKCVTMEIKVPGDLVYVLGQTRDELGAGEYYQMMDWVGLNVPKVDAEKVIPLYHALSQAIRRGGLVASCHAVGRGGLGIHLALCAMGGNLGMDIDLRSVPVAEKLSNTRLLYSESASRFIVTIDPKKKGPFENMMDGLDYACIGRVTDADILQVSGIDGKIIIKEKIGDLKDAWNEPFGDLV
jgi:phosphoribosylformylglycinamidine synthase